MLLLLLGPSGIVPLYTTDSICSAFPPLRALSPPYLRSITGNLSDSIGMTSFLTNLYLGGNNISGTIPARLGSSSQLTMVDLSNNPWLVGKMPSLRCAVTCAVLRAGLGFVVLGGIGFEL